MHIMIDNGIIRAQGLDYKDGKFVEVPIEISLQPDSSATGEGKPITVAAAKHMVMGYLQPLQQRYEEVRGTDQEKEVLDEVVAMTFGKETIMLLLSQAGCEGIRFYLCKNDNDKRSLVMAGIGKNRADLSQTNSRSFLEWDSTKPTDTLLEEVSGPKTLRDFQSILRKEYSVSDPLAEYIGNLFKF